MRDKAVDAVVRAATRDDDHLALGLRETGIAQHQRVVIGEERAELRGPAREREEHVGTNPAFSCTSRMRARTSSGRPSISGIG